MTTVLPLQTAKLSPDLQLAYIDSFHALPIEERPSSYTTVVGIHGVGFNSHVWTPLLPFLPTNVRFVAYNQRGYTGSSPAFEIKEEGGVDAAGAYLSDTMEFFRFVVDELGAKKVEDGGVVLLGWSKGTTPLMSLLAFLHLSSSPTSTSFAGHLPLSGLPHLSLLTTHLRSILLFEPPGSALGRLPTSDYTGAMAAVSPPNTSTPSEFADAFAGWIGGYSDPTSASPAEVSSLPPSGLEALSPEILAAAWEPSLVAHGFSWRLAATGPEVASLAKTALAPPLSPAVPIGLIFGGRTNGYCLDAAATIEELWGVKGTVAGVKGESSGEEQEQKVKSKTAIRKIEHSNHFAFVHEPEAFVKTVVELIEELGA